MKAINLLSAALFVSLLAGTSLAKDSQPKDLWDRVEHHNANSNGVKIHYVAIGKGPLIVMIHGFPDFWYTWRKQMDALSGRYRVVAVDQRGYDLSDHPTGVTVRDALVGKRHWRRHPGRGPQQRGDRRT